MAMRQSAPGGACAGQCLTTFRTIVAARAHHVNHHGGEPKGEVEVPSPTMKGYGRRRALSPADRFSHQGGRKPASPVAGGASIVPPKTWCQFPQSIRPTRCHEQLRLHRGRGFQARRGVQGVPHAHGARACQRLAARETLRMNDLIRTHSMSRHNAVRGKCGIQARFPSRVACRSGLQRDAGRRTRQARIPPEGGVDGSRIPTTDECI